MESRIGRIFHSYCEPLVTLKQINKIVIVSPTLNNHSLSLNDTTYQPRWFCHFCMLVREKNGIKVFL